MRLIRLNLSDPGIDKLNTVCRKLIVTKVIQRYVLLLWLDVMTGVVTEWVTQGVDRPRFFFF